MFLRLNFWPRRLTGQIWHDNSNCGVAVAINLERVMWKSLPKFNRHILIGKWNTMHYKRIGNKIFELLGHHDRYIIWSYWSFFLSHKLCRLLLLDIEGNFWKSCDKLLPPNIKTHVYKFAFDLYKSNDHIICVKDTASV